MTGALAILPPRFRRLTVVAGALAALWLGGLAWFVAGSLAPAQRPEARTDAIVVLTGGRARLETGVDLLGAGKARKLFISGVNQRVDRAALTRVFAPVADRAQCCVVLGHDADNTFGNARETALWMRQEGYASLRLVTSWYHMPRSLLEFRHAMPGVTILASPVFAERDAGQDRAAAWLAAAAVTVAEYDKFLAVGLRLSAETAWAGLSRPAPSGAAAVASARNR